jgi:hypothetical protein
MRVAFQDAAVHERAWVALVCIADHVLWAALHPAGERPFASRRKARAAPSAQPGVGHLFDNLLRRHFSQDFTQRLITVNGKVILDVIGVNLSTVTKDDSDFFGAQRTEFLVHNGLDFLAETLDNASFKKMLLDQIGNIVHAHPAIVHSLRIHHHFGTFGTFADSRSL